MNRFMQKGQQSQFFNFHFLSFPASICMCTYIYAKKASFCSVHYEISMATISRFTRKSHQSWTECVIVGTPAFFVNSCYATASFTLLCFALWDSGIVRRNVLKNYQKVIKCQFLIDFINWIQKMNKIFFCKD